jgi:hypothetical protein
MRIDARGDLRCHLDADPASAEVFAHAFDEAVSPIADPRYLLPCWRLPASAAGPARLVGPDAVGHRFGSPDRTELGARAQRAGHEEGQSGGLRCTSWDTWIGGGDPVYTRNPEGAGTLAAVRGSDPWGLTSVLRLRWR